MISKGKGYSCLLCVRACVCVCSRAVDALEPSTRYVRVGEKVNAAGRWVYEGLATGVIPPPIIAGSPRRVRQPLSCWELGGEKKVFFRGGHGAQSADDGLIAIAYSG